MRPAVLLLALGAGGCVKAEVLDCGNGVVCPTTMTCDLDNATCIDAHGLSAPEGMIDFGPIGCGATSQSQSLLVSNFGATPIEIHTRSTITGVTVSPDTTEIAAADGAELQVTATAPAESIPGQPFEGTVVVNTPYQLLERAIRFETKGGIASASNVDFGETFNGNDATHQLLIGNTGNAPFDVSATTTSPGFSLTSDPVLLHVEAGSTMPIGVTFSPTAEGPVAGSVQLTYTGAMCQQGAMSVALNGVASGDLVLADHTALDFGAALCGSDEAIQSLTLVNHSTSPQTVTASISGSSAARFRTEGTVTIPGGTSTIATSAILHVTRLAIPQPDAPKPFSATLDLDIEPAMLQKHIDLKTLITGAVLTVDTSNLELDTVKGGVVSKTVFVTNASTLSTVTVDPPTVTVDGVKLSVSPSTFQVVRGGMVPITFTLVGGGSVASVPPTKFTFNAIGQCSTPPTVTVQGKVSGGTGGEMVIIEDPEKLP